MSTRISGLDHPGTPGQAGRPIVVTGSNRSGTTWTGRMLAQAPGTVYIHEPFSPSARRAPFYPRNKQWSVYIDESNSGYFEPRISRLVELRYPLLGAIVHEPTLRGKLSGGREWSRFRRERRAGSRAILKDPTAIFACEWLEKTFDSRMLILVRHPGAYVASILKKRWWYDFEHLATQTSLMDRLLGDLAEEVHRLCREEHDFIENAAYHWLVVHHVIRGYQARHPDWIFRRHDRLAADP